MPHMSTYKEHREAGFTLIELLVVVLIIAVLAAIAIPVFLSQRKKAADSSLRSDLRTAATAYITYSLDHSNRDFINTASSNVVYILSPNSDVAPIVRSSKSQWHQHPEFPELDLTDGNSIELVVMPKANARWTSAHQDGEFCMIGATRNGTYNAVFWAQVGAQAYKDFLYYDSSLGGVKTMDELLEAQDAGERISCTGHPNTYRQEVLGG